MGAHHPGIPRWLRFGALAWCALLPLVFGAIALSASRTKSATMDEPLHAVGAYLHVFYRDFRINPEDPPLWNYWAMLPHTRDSLRVNFDDPEWAKSLLSTDYQTRVTTRTLYQTPGNDGIRFVQRTRAVMTPLGVLLGWLIAWWAWQLAGPVAGMVAVALYSFDPNFLAHAPLVKNDVAISLLLLAVAMALWRVMRRATWWNVALLGLLSGAALATKFSGIIVPFLYLLVLQRPMLREPWLVPRRKLTSVFHQYLAALTICFTGALLSLLVIWASYGFRFDPTPAPRSILDLRFQVKAAIQNEFFKGHGRYATEREYASLKPPIPVRLALTAEGYRLLPHAYVHGFVYTYQTSIVRSAYLLGEVSRTGWWYYFPLAMLFKTPLATLAGLLVLAVTAAGFLRERFRGAYFPHADSTALTMLLAPAGAYAMLALLSNLNLGLRHMLPVYPFLYILIGWCAATLARRRPRATGAIAAVLVVALAVESLASYPHFIPFFNAVFKPNRLELLSDSNLDWGQDLPLLAKWRRRNPHVRLYLCYFGSADPAAYGIDDYVNLPPGFWLGPPFELPSTPGVIAISATFLQNNHMPNQLRDYYSPLRPLTPREVLGGSIYLYDYPPR